MNIDIRKSIEANFQNSTEKEIEESIEEAIQGKEEVILPGFGVFFEILWENSTKEEQDRMLKILKENLS